MIKIIKYDLIAAHKNGVRQHPQLDVESTGGKVISFNGQELGDFVIMQVENLPDGLPTHIYEIASSQYTETTIWDRKTYSPQEASEYIENQKAFLETSKGFRDMRNCWGIDRIVASDSPLSIPGGNDIQQRLFPDSEPYFLDAERINLTCNTCEHRQRHQCNSKVFQYCGVRKSNRTDNGLLKIKCKTAACPLYKH